MSEKDRYGNRQPASGIPTSRPGASHPVPASRPGKPVGNSSAAKGGRPGKKAA
jgi:hypothetical protein